MVLRHSLRFTLPNGFCSEYVAISVGACTVLGPDGARSREDAYLVPSRMIFMGRWLRYSGTYPTYQARLFHCDRCRFTDYGHGQREVCRLWNLVAEDTREGEVFTRCPNRFFLKAGRSATFSLVTGSRSNYPRVTGCCCTWRRRTRLRTLLLHRRTGTVSADSAHR